jgi:predicted esterase
LDQLSSSEQTIPVSYLFAHGLGATYNQATSLFAQIRCEQADGSIVCNPYWIMKDPIALFNFPDAKNDQNEYHKEAVNLGQQKDMARLHEAIRATKNELPNHDLILAGISRGSAAIINYVALYQPDCVKALVLESPFDTLKSIINHLMKRFGVSWVPFSEKIGFKIAQSQFPELDLQGVVPLKTAPYLPYDLPILLIHSKKDKVIPVKCSREIYMILRQTGHQHVYLFELHNGAHGKLMNGPDAIHYQNVVHAFYKKYKLPHHEPFARDGEHLLLLSQPTINDVKIRNTRFAEQASNED